MKKVCVVQARNGNTRFPGKNGKMLLGKPQIWHVLSRIKRCQSFSEIILAIPHESNGEILKDAAHELDIPVLDYKGDYNNVLRRHVLAAEIMDGDIIIRIPGDNTLVDPDLVDDMVWWYDANPAPWNVLTTNLDLNVLNNGYPAGLGCEIYDVRFLQWLDKTERNPQFREHPHKWAFYHDQLYTMQAPSWLNIRHQCITPTKFSVDTEQEWEWMNNIYWHLYPDNHDFRIRDIIKFLGEANEQSYRSEPSHT
jgi:spore coat polysaccharide biosynthesis protein SpsF